MIGGGIKDKTLCSLTASACGVPVYAGPVEATVIGNAIAQFVSLKKINNLKQARKIVKTSFDIALYYPEETVFWEKLERKYDKIIYKYNLKTQLSEEHLMYCNSFIIIFTIAKSCGNDR